MKIKRMVKRLFAVGAGATMLGATAMGALAADLGNYPNDFVTDGTFDGFMVVGENAAAVDNLAMTDIAASMKVVGSSATTTTTVAGDNWLVATSSKKLEMVNSNASDSSLGGETFRDINTFIGDEELDALADGKWSTNENEYGFQQFLFFDAVPSGDTGATNSRIVKYTENDDDETADHLFIKSGRQIARYKLEFTSTAQSDVTDSSGSADTTGTYLDDFENTDINMMGKPYTVVQARRPSGAVQKSVKLVMMAGSTRDTLLEGESKTYTVKDKEYDVTLTFTDADEAKFTVNGEATNKLKAGETYVLSDKSEVGVSEVLYQAYAGGVHSATFYLGASKIELRDDGIDTDGGAYNLKVGSEDIDGTTVEITGTDDNTTATISTIELNMSAEDDYFVGAGGKLSDAIIGAGEEEEVLWNGAFDIEYQGLTDETTHDLRLKSASSRKYSLELFDGDGNAVSIPLIYAEDQYNLSLGEDTQVSTGRQGQKRLMLNETTTTQNANAWQTSADNSIFKDDYFVLTGGTDSDGSAKSYLMQYKGADRTTKTSPKIKFKNLGSGQTLEYSVTDPGAGATGTVATIKVGGYSFLVQNASSGVADDFQVNVDMDGAGSVVGAGSDAKLITFVDYYGTTWTFKDVTTNLTLGNVANGSSSATDFLTLVQSTANGDDYDNMVPASLTLNITGAAGPEVRATVAGVTLLTPDGETEVSYGYTSMGAKITFNEPASDPDELTLTYPEKQRLPQVFFTSGATSTSSSASGDLTRVSIVDATKLDSEIASVSAQNLIAVGGPCVNTVAAELLGNPSDCTQGFTPGKARIRLFEHANGNVAMLVAGYSGADTRLAGKVVAHRWQEMSGVEVQVEGTTYSDATIGAPTVAAAPAGDAMQ
jgi:hypothetical protein